MAGTMADKLSTVTPDYTGAILSVAPHDAINITGFKHQKVVNFLDEQTETFNFDIPDWFIVDLTWNRLSALDTSTIFDFYMNSSKGKGITRTFPWEHPDGNTYTVRFYKELTNAWLINALKSMKGVTFKVMGNYVV